MRAGNNASCWLRSENNIEQQLELDAHSSMSPEDQGHTAPVELGVMSGPRFFLYHMLEIIVMHFDERQAARGGRGRGEAAVAGREGAGDCVFAEFAAATGHERAGD